VSWISDAIEQNKEDILKAVHLLIESEKLSLPFTKDEVLNHCKTTVDLLIDALCAGENAPIFEYWEAIGKESSLKEIPISEIPKALEILKRAIWSTMEAKVESGDVTLADLVDAMMVVESVLSDCSYVMMRSYLGSRDIKAAKRSDRTQALYELTEVLSEEGDSLRMYKGMVEKAANIIGVKRASILLFNNSGELEPVASNSEDALDSLNSSSPQEIDALAALLSLGGPVVVETGKENPGELESLMKRYGTSVALIVPLRSGEKDIGVIILDDGKYREFASEQIDIAVAVANQLSIGVERGHLLSEMEKRLKHMAAIGIVAKTVSSYLDPKEQLSSLLEMAAALMRADGGLIMLKDAMFQELRIEATSGDANIFENEEDLKKATEWVCKNAKCLLLRKGLRDHRFPGLALKVQSCIIAPLAVREKVIGIIGIGTNSKEETYSREDVEMFGNFASQAAVSIENTQLYDKLQDTYIGTIGALAAAIEARDPYTVGHSARVTQYSVAIAQELGLSSQEVEEIRLAGLLHDLGKIGVPDSVLNKPGRLSDEEYQAIRMHPALSMKILEPLPHLANLMPIIYHHHERYNGHGYIDGKAGEDIPLGARIIAVADAYEAMTSDRPYRKALSREEAVSELKRNAGTQFDPKVVDAFLRLLEKTDAERA